MSKRIANKRYTAEFKKAVIKTILKEKPSCSGIARRLEFCNHHRIQKWERVYPAEGPEGFKVERRGRRNKGRPRQLRKK